MALIATMIPDFDTSSILESVEVPLDLGGILSFLQQMLLYDGFPTFLPCKMIMQNPNIAPPSGDWLSEFRYIDDDWLNITNTNYWKLFSKTIGNIDIRSWSGDINICTSGTLGNAGNINISAKNKYGNLPEYKTGNVNITADTPFRVYTDPRDLFLDTHLLGKLTGKFAWFSNANGPTGKTPPPISIKPLNPVQMILSLLGVPFEFGFASDVSNGRWLYAMYY